MHNIAQHCKFVISRPFRQALLGLVQQALLGLVQQALLGLVQQAPLGLVQQALLGLHVLLYCDFHIGG